MKDFIVNNISSISAIVGSIFFFFMVIMMTYLSETKYEIIIKWYFIIVLIIGVFASSEAIGRWIIK